MQDIKNRAHRYAVSHRNSSLAIQRAYVDGAISERENMKKEIKHHRIKVFISGKVTGEDHYVALRRFCEAERHLEQIGYTVINPMMLCRKEWSWLRCMAVCLWHLSQCRCIYQLAGWQQSRGARIENFVAKLFKKTFL